MVSSKIENLLTPDKVLEIFRGINDGMTGGAAAQV